MRFLLILAAAMVLFVGTPASAQLPPVDGPETPLGDCNLGIPPGTLCCTGAGPLEGGYITCTGSEGPPPSGICCADDNGAGDDGDPNTPVDACGNTGGTSPTCLSSP
ncbi:MAG: hypothetical protein ACREQ9_15025 [Candidatus Binatia bacterium]